MMDLWALWAWVAFRFGLRVVELLNKARNKTLCLEAYAALCRVV